MPWSRSLDEPDPRQPPDPKGVLRDPEDAVEGWRIWFVKRHVGMALYSGSGYLWQPRRAPRAICPYGCSLLDLPGESCQCGFHSLKGIDFLADVLAQEPEGLPPGDWVRVVGQAASWCRVVEGDRGWRASRSYPTRLWVPHDAVEMVAPLRRAYAVPVDVRNFEVGRGV